MNYLRGPIINRVLRQQNKNDKVKINTKLLLSKFNSIKNDIISSFNNHNNFFLINLQQFENIELDVFEKISIIETELTKAGLNLTKESIQMLPERNMLKLDLTKM